MIESFVKALNFYIFPSSEAEGYQRHLQYVTKNNHMYIPYFIIRIFVEIPDKYLIEKFFMKTSKLRLRKEFNTALLKYVKDNAGFTFMESLETLNLLHKITKLIDIQDPDEMNIEMYNKIFKFVSNPIYINKFVQVASTGYEIMYRNFIQYRNERLKYHVNIVLSNGLLSLTEGEIREEIIELSAWQKGREYLSTCADFFNDVMWLHFGFVNEAYKEEEMNISIEQMKEVRVNKLIQILHHSGFFDHFGAMCKYQAGPLVMHNVALQERNVNSLLLMMEMISSYQYGRDLIANDIGLIDFIGEKSVSAYDSISTITRRIMLNMLEDPKHFSHVLQEWGYCLQVMTMSLQRLGDLCNFYSFIGRKDRCKKSKIGLKMCKVVLKETTDKQNEIRRICVAKVIREKKKRKLNWKDEVKERKKIKKNWRKFSYPQVIFDHNLGLRFAFEEFEDFDTSFYRKGSDFQHIFKVRRNLDSAITLLKYGVEYCNSLYYRILATELTGNSLNPNFDFVLFMDITKFQECYEDLKQEMNDGSKDNNIMLFEQYKINHMTKMIESFLLQEFGHIFPDPLNNGIEKEPAPKPKMNMIDVLWKNKELRMEKELKEEDMVDIDVIDIEEEYEENEETRERGRSQEEVEKAYKEMHDKFLDNEL